MDTLTDSVARLHRAGSENSQSTEKLRVAANTLLRWIKENVPDGHVLPLGCRMFPSGEFVREGLTNHPLGTTREIFRMNLDQEHDRMQLFHFSGLIAEGFIDKLSASLEQEAKVFRDTAQKVAILTSFPEMDSGFAWFLEMDVDELKKKKPTEIIELVEMCLRKKGESVNEMFDRHCPEAAMVVIKRLEQIHKFFTTNGINLKPWESYIPQRIRN